MKVFIFDMDGTFIYSMDYWNNLMANYLRSQKIDPGQNLSGELLHMTLEDGIKYIKKKYALPQSLEEITKDLRDLMAYNYKNTFEMDDKILSIFQRIKNKGDKIVLATATQRDLVDIVLDRFSLNSCFDLECVSDEMDFHKDDPRYFQYIADHFKVDIKDCVVIEDALYSIKTATKLGMTALGVLAQASKDHIDQIKALTEKSVERVGQLEDYFISYGY
ncbi:MAG: HAD family phosphatase [Bacillota bacterium]|nr:HAD family phosphatase [Bacillota bacterium]